jgi:hypothetical protein
MIGLVRWPSTGHIPEREHIEMTAHKDVNAPARMRTVEDLGRVVRAVRRRAGADQASAAGLAGVGTRFFGDIERGKPGVRLGLVLRVLDRLGLEVWIAPRGWRP